MLGNDLDRLETMLWEAYKKKVEEWKKKWEGDYIRATNTGWKLKERGKKWRDVPEIIKEAMIAERIKKMALDTHRSACIILNAQGELAAGEWEEQETAHWRG